MIARAIAWGLLLLATPAPSRFDEQLLSPLFESLVATVLLLDPSHRLPGRRSALLPND